MSGDLILLAWRNILRNARRSLLTIASVAFGLAAVMFGQSLLRSFQRQMIEKSTGVMLGHIQVQARAAEDRKVPEVLISEGAKYRAILARDGRLRDSASRLLFTGLVQGSGGSRGVLVVGVEPEAEKRLSILPGYLTEGRYLGESPRDIFLGAKLAKDIDVRLGERAVVLAQSASGTMNSELFRVAGLYHAGSTAYDGQVVYIPLEAAQRIRGVGTQISHLVGRLSDVRAAEDFVRDNRSSFSGDEAELYSYKDVGSEIVGIKKFQDALLVVVLMIIFSIVGLGILNTISMSFYERIREFGVLRAVGARSSVVLRVLLMEAAMMGSLGSVIGLIVGGSLIGFFGHIGLELPLGRAMAYFMPFDDRIFMRPEWPLHLKSAAGVLAVSVAAALAPAVKASRLVITEALAHV
jgi:ABC-type lipoprotein release transport system permease subunit